MLPFVSAECSFRQPDAPALAKRDDDESPVSVKARARA